MARFRYKAVTPAGKVVEGALEAASRAAVIDHLRNDGYLPIRADEVGAGFELGRLLRDRGAKRLSPQDLVLMTRELATLLQAGLSLERALALSVELATGVQKEFLHAVLDAVRRGIALSEALAAQSAPLPPFYVGLVHAGEAGGTLATVLGRLADTLERSHALREGIRSALYYPVIVLVVAGLTMIVLLTVVIPEFAPLFEDNAAAIPLEMRVLLAMGDLIKGWGWLGGLGLLVLVVGIRQLKRQPAGRLRWDGWMRRLPLLGDLTVKIEVARFARTLGTLLANGVTALDALTIAVGAIGNRAVARAVDGVTGRLRRGEGLSGPLLETGVFPRLAVRLVQVGEESGQLDAMLLQVADIYDEEVKRTLQKLLALLVPIVTIVLGLVVAGIVASMLSAMLGTYDLSL